MGVGVKEVLGPPPAALQSREDLVHAVASVYHDRLAAAFVGHNRAVARQRSYREGLNGHELVHVNAEIVKSAVEVAQRRSRTRAAGENVSDQDGMRAGLVFLCQLAVKVSDGAVQHRRARRVDRIGDLRELAIAYLSGEVLGEPALIAGKDVDAKNSRARDKEIAACLAVDAD